MDELSISNKLLEYRKQQPNFKDISFTTICAYRENAALMHYHPTEKQYSKVEASHLLLIDSGGQYLTGTTDITRTFVLGEMTPEERKDFTIALKAMFRLQNAHFIQDVTTGANLDILARGVIYDYDLDYRCGTGHGVGHFLNVHEGPNGLRPKSLYGHEACIVPGMITTDEPGVYVEGSHGIRHENELLCVKHTENEYGTFLKFEPITYVPFDIEAAKNPKRGVHQRLECLYNSMLWPVKNFTAKGFLWYQGESNISNYQFYAPMMTAMVQLWRNVWEAPDMPFYYVQIAPYKYENSSNTGAALLREAQMEALKTIPNSGMVPTTDIGDEFCIHPPQKDVVGLRLATLALTKTYGIRRLPSNGPTMTKVDYADKKAIVTFDNAPVGLFPTFSELEGFEIAGADKKFYPAKAKIVGRTNTVEVWSEEVAQPVAVRYAFRNYVGNITLRNTFGLSAFPFRTDTWDDVK